MKEQSKTGAGLAQVAGNGGQDSEKTVYDPGFARSSPAVPASDKTLPLSASAADTDHEKTVLDLGSWAPDAVGGPSDASISREGMRIPDSAPNDPRRAIKAKPAAVHTPLPNGFRIFEYRIDGLLGQGGFGIAYAATDVNLNSKVVIKEYLPEDFAYRTTDNSVCARNDEDQDFYQTGLDSFLVEARTLATFRHPNIVRVARFFEANRTAYMVLEYEKGQSLKAWRKKHENVPEADIVNLLAPLFNGLAVVHRAGYLHRDIKPDNIYVRDEDGSLVLLDFGAARQVASQKAETGAVVTPGYAAIEQYAGGGRQGPWTDLYAMGATLFWLVTGKKPFDAPTRMAESDPQPTAMSLCKGKYSDDFLEAIDWALKMHPSDRPQDMDQFRKKLFGAHASALGLTEALKRGGDDEDGEVRESWAVTLRSPRLLKARLTRFGRALRRPANWPIAVKMTLAMVLTALAPLLIVAYYNYDRTERHLTGVELGNLEQLAQSTAGRIAQLIGDSRNLADYVGTDDDFVNYLVNPTPAGTQETLRKLNGLVKANPDIQFTMVMDTQGNALVATDPNVMGKNFQFREYFKQAMQGKGFMTGIIVGSVAGAAGFFYSRPVFDAQGGVIGAVVMRIKAEPVGRILSSAQVNQDRIPFLIDGDGVVVFHPNDKQMFKSLMPLTKAQLDEIVADQRFRRKVIESMNEKKLHDAMVNTKARGNVSYFSNVTKREEIAGYAPVPGNDWVVGVSESRAYFAAPLEKLFWNVVASVVIVGAVFVFLALWFARSIVRPIERLTGAAHALKRGDYEKANIAVRTSDEIGQLARTFNVMIDVLRQRERERGGKGKGERGG